MNSFVYSYPTKNYFGIGCVKENLAKVLSAYGKNVLLAYGGSSIKKNGVYEEITGILKAAGNNVTEFTGIMSNPTYAKVQEGAALVREKNIDLIFAVGGGSVIDCCKIVSAQAMLEQDIRNDTKLLFRNDPAADLAALAAGKKVLFVYGGGSAKRNGCYDDVKKAVENAIGPAKAAIGSDADLSLQRFRVWYGSCSC